MQMKQCPNGHFYDQSLNASCPYCTSTSANVNVTQANSPGGVGLTMPVENPDISEHTRPGNLSQPADSDRTMAIIQKEMGIDPVVGWIVCTKGKEKGKDYRIHADNNFIGRSEKMDICIRGDDTISRENHAIISYDTQENLYYFSPGEGRSIVRFNGKAIFATVELKAYDEIGLGSCKFIFIPLCGEEFNWKK